MKRVKFAFAKILLGFGLATTFTACGDDDTTSASNSDGGIVSCYSYNVVDEDDGTEINESCMQAEKGTIHSKKVTEYCATIKAFLGHFESDKVELGTGCPDKKTIITCLDGGVSVRFYSLDNEQQELIVDGDDAQTCANLLNQE